MQAENKPTEFSQALAHQLEEACQAQKISRDCLQNCLVWLSSPVYQDIREDNRSSWEWLEQWAVNQNWQEIENRFYTRLIPGTAGIRGQVGVGSSLINKATVGLFVQAHASYLQKNPEPGREGIVLGYDSRSGSYSMETRGPGFLTCMIAEIYAAAGIPVYVSARPLPTPVVAHAVVEFGFGPSEQLVLAGGICTASHNPSSDNGYKIYEPDGHQVVNSGFKTKLQEQLNHLTDFSEVRHLPQEPIWPGTSEELEDKLQAGAGWLHLETARAPITLFDPKLLINHYASVARQVTLQASSPETGDFTWPSPVTAHLAQNPIVITALKGNCAQTVHTLFNSHGLMEDTHYYFVPEEREPDNSLDTGTGDKRGKPNPEYAESFHRSRQFIKKLATTGTICNTVLASDPDSDRMGILEIQPDGREVYFTGNEQLSMNAAYETCLMKAPDKALVIKSRPSGNQLSTIYHDCWAQVTLFSVLVGFKHFGQVIAYYNNQAIACRQKKEPHFDRLAFSNLNLKDRHKLLQESGALVFISGGEESMGQTYGNDCAEKDTPRAMARFSEMKAWLRNQGAGFHDFLESIHDTWGLYKEKIILSSFPGAQGDRMKQAVMQHLRESKNLPEKLGPYRLLAIIDYLDRPERAACCFQPDGTVLFDKTCTAPEFTLPGTQVTVPTFNLPLGDNHNLCINSSNYIQFVLEGGSSLHIRPSGTEPILKQYLNLKLNDESILSLEPLSRMLAAPNFGWVPGTGWTDQLDKALPEKKAEGILKGASALQRLLRARQMEAGDAFQIAGWSGWNREDRVLLLKACGLMRALGGEMLEKNFTALTTSLDRLAKQAGRET